MGNIEQMDFFKKNPEKMEEKIDILKVIDECLRNEEELNKQADGTFKPSLGFFARIIIKLNEKLKEQGANEQLVTESNYEITQVKIAQRLRLLGYSDHFTPAIERLMKERGVFAPKEPRHKAGKLDFQQRASGEKEEDEE